MNASFYLPVRLYFGKGAVKNNAKALCLGKHALIVTGKSSAKKSGALDDITAALRENGISFTLFDEVTENPPLLLCHKAGKLAIKSGADFVIGIGGGSPLDAAKAIAVFAANPHLSPLDVYDAAMRTSPALPIVAVPTTAGTGSEVNFYSVLTLPDGERKQTLKADDTWPRIAFTDYKYTETLPRDITVSTALDAFAHALESYLSPKSTVFSRNAALFAATELWDVLSMAPATFTEEMREKLSAAASAAGMAISVTGTGFPHPLGYSLTLLDGIPHGRACAAFAGEYISFNEKHPEGKRLIDEFTAAIGAGPKALKALLPGLADVSLSLTNEEIDHHVGLVCDSASYKNCPYVLTKEEMIAIYKRLFQK